MGRPRSNSRPPASSASWMHRSPRASDPKVDLHFLDLIRCFLLGLRASCGSENRVHFSARCSRAARHCMRSAAIYAALTVLGCDQLALAALTGSLTFGIVANSTL